MIISNVSGGEHRTAAAPVFCPRQTTDQSRERGRSCDCSRHRLSSHRNSRRRRFVEENGTISDWVFVSLFFYYTVLHVEETRSFISFASCHAGRQQHGFHDEVCVLDFFASVFYSSSYQLSVRRPQGRSDGPEDAQPIISAMRSTAPCGSHSCRPEFRPESVQRNV